MIFKIELNKPNTNRHVKTEWEKPKRLQQRNTANLKDTESWRSRLPKEKEYQMVLQLQMANPEHMYKKHHID